MLEPELNLSHRAKAHEKYVKNTERAKREIADEKHVTLLPGERKN